MKTVTFRTQVIPNWPSLPRFNGFPYYVGLPGWAVRQELKRVVDCINVRTAIRNHEPWVRVLLSTRGHHKLPV
jgi:hypothetical protein